jgi:hypothetical protein
VAVFALTNAFAYCAGYDFTTDTNNLVLGVDAAALDSTAFGGSGWTSLIGGLRSGNFQMGGFFQSAVDQAPDPQAFPQLGTADQVFTFGEDATEASPVYMFQGMKSQYVLGGTVGEIAPFQLASTLNNGVGAVRGQLAKARGTVSATGAIGTAVNLGAASSSQYVYCAVHVFSAGTTITLQLQSDDSGAFSSPTTVATIGPLTTTGGTWMTRVAGPATDTYYRINVSAITGSFIVAAAIGVQ